MRIAAEPARFENCETGWFADLSWVNSLRSCLGGKNHPDKLCVKMYINGVALCQGTTSVVPNQE
jgi:hypothetical protein